MNSASASMPSDVMSSTKAIALIGATGHVVTTSPLCIRFLMRQVQGSRIVKTLLASSQISAVSTISRRHPGVEDPGSLLDPHVISDNQEWASELIHQVPRPDIFFSGLGTTRGAAGSVATQRKIDYELNVEMAQAAKRAGAHVYVLISAAGANNASFLPYPKMKGELEEAIAAMEFDKTVFVKPGFLIGQRSSMKFGESGAQAVANMMGRMSGDRLKDVWAQDAEVVARAAVSAGLLASMGQGPPDKIWNLSQSDIVRLGRTEWRD